ncbi:unnamed protein product [Chrysoparadoxa australica]
MRSLGSVLLLSAPCIQAFFSSAPGLAHQRISASNALAATNLASTSRVTVDAVADTEFQMEELEDKETCVTSLVLNKDGSILVGATEGPIPASSTGVWSLLQNELFMSITREFTEDVSYSVTREFRGVAEELAADTLCFSGEITMDEAKVGFFEMLQVPTPDEDHLLL